MIKAILFDMDGTLIDSERPNLDFMIETCREFGFNVDREDILSMRSISPEGCSEFYRSKYGEDFDFFRIRDSRREKMRNYVENEGLQVKPGVYELMDFLDDINIKTAVVTSNQYDRAVNYMKMIDLDGRFDYVISAAMVKNGKPAPDVYLYASEKVGEIPVNCIAVEDSPNGVQSAYSAGCNVAVVPDITPADEMMKKNGKWILNDLSELIPIIESEISPL